MEQIAPQPIAVRKYRPTYRIMSRIFWEQVFTLTRANLKSRYRKTFAGFLWVVLNPLIMFSVYALVMSKFLQVNVPNYSLFLIAGMLPWIFIVQSLEMCTPLLVNSSQLLKSFPIDPMVLVMAQILDNLINFSAAFLLIFIPVWLHSPGSTEGFPFIPLAILVMGIGVVGMAWLLATAQVFFRDTKFILNFIVSIAFVLTPVFYPVEMVPAQYRWLVQINPFYRLIQPFQVAIYDFSPGTFYQSILASGSMAVGVLILAALVWQYKRNDVYFYV